MKNILNFEIGDDLHISDHTNLKVSIDINIAKQQDSLETSTANCSSIPLVDIFPHGRGFKMDAKSRANLLGRLNSAKFHNEIQSLLRHISTNQENPIENINLFTQWLNELSNKFFKKERAYNGHIKNEDGFGYQRWYDIDCKLLYQKLIKAKSIYGRGSKQFKELRNLYNYTCRRKKMTFELAMSDKLAALRGKNTKEFWKLLKEGFQFNRVGDIDMDTWYTHFSKLF